MNDAQMNQTFAKKTHPHELKQSPKLLLENLEQKYIHQLKKKHKAKTDIRDVENRKNVTPK